MLPLGIYRHYKGFLYRVIAIARHTETLKPLVVYYGLSGEHRTWVRPLDMFLEEVIIDGKLMDRFTLVHEDPFAFPPSYHDQLTLPS